MGEIEGRPPELKGKMDAKRWGGGGAGDQKAIFDYVKMASLAFWDAYLKDDAKAKDYFKSDALPAYSKGAVVLSKK